MFFSGCVLSLTTFSINFCQSIWSQSSIYWGGCRSLESVGACRYDVVPSSSVVALMTLPFSAMTSGAAAQQPPALVSGIGAS